MTNILRFAHPDKLREQARADACNWLARLDAGATAADLQQIDVWLAADPLHVEMLLEMAELWDQSSILSELAQVFPLKQYVPVSARQRRRRVQFALAASLLVGAIGLLTSGWLKTTAVLQPDITSLMPGPEFHETRIGQQSTVDLVDGSQVILNTNTRIGIFYTPGERHVLLLRGESHFQVARDEARPFRVHAGRSIIEATGTAFAVQHVQDASIEVTVTEGSVKLVRPATVVVPAAMAAGTQLAAVAAAEPSATVIPLVAGEHALANEGSAAIEKTTMQPAEMEVQLAWRHGMLLFQGDPLDKVLQEVSRYTSITIEADENIRDIPVGGYFKAGDIEGLLVAMEQNFHIESELVGENHIRLKAK